MSTGTATSTRAWREGIAKVGVVAPEIFPIDSDAFDCLDTPGADGLGECTVITIVLVGIAFREVGD